MASIIKATDRNAGIQPIAFNLDDLAAQAAAQTEKYIEGVRAEAEKILTEAKEQANKESAAIRRRAEAEGHEAGRASGREVAEEFAKEKTATVLPALQKIVQDIEHAKQGWLAHWEKASIHLAAAIAERIIRQRLPDSPEVTATLVREALELASGSNRLRILLSPTDHAALETQIQTMAGELLGMAEAEIVADPTISPGGCKVETQYGVIDHRLESQLARIEEELTRD